MWSNISKYDAKKMNIYIAVVNVIRFTADDILISTLI